MAGWKHIIADGPLGPLYRPWFGWNADQEAFTRLPSVQSLLQRSEETSPVLPQEDDARLERLSRLWCGKIPPVHPNPHIAQHVNDLPSPISTATHPHSPASATLPFTQLNGSGSALTPTIVNVLEHTLKLLRRVFVVTSTNTIIEPQAASLCWPIVIPDAFIDMVQAHNPYALVLLAHYCILLKRNDSRWWIEGKAEELLHKIRILLDREAGAERWEDWILWPVAEVGEMGMGSSRGGSQGGSRATSLAGTPGSAVVLEGGVALAPMQVEDVRMRDR